MSFPEMPEAPASPSVTTVTLSDYVTQDSVTSFVDQLRSAIGQCQKNKQPWLPVYINTYGGSVYQGLAAMDFMMNSPVPIITISYGTTMSMGVPLFSCGKKRYVAPSSTLMIHGVSAGIEGKLDDMAVGLKETRRLEELSDEITERNCGLPKGTIRKITRKKKSVDKYITAEKALKLGIATHIGLPNFSVKVKKKLKYKMGE